MIDALVAYIAATHALATLPRHLRGGEVGRTFQTGAVYEDSGTPNALPQLLTAPLDHNNASAGQWQLRYWLNETSATAADGPILLMMPGEGATTGCGESAIARTLGALSICWEHRFFGRSIPRHNATGHLPRELRYLSVEQNLADGAMLLLHVRATRPGHVGAVAVGGSYSGASAAWMRQAYPELVDAAVAQSPPVTVRVDFPEYDTSNLVALASPDSRCAATAARVSLAIDRLIDSSLPDVLDAFNFTLDPAAASVSLTDFAYALGDSTASAVQYGRKQLLCDALTPLYPMRYADDWTLAHAFADYTRMAWGPGYFSNCFYNSTCMRASADAVPAESARSWYWLKCTQLGYLQTAPATGLKTRPALLTKQALLIA